MNSTTDLYLKRWNNLKWSTANYFCSNDDTFLPEMDELNSFDYTSDMFVEFGGPIGGFHRTKPIWERNEKIIRTGDSPV